MLLSPRRRLRAAALSAVVVVVPAGSAATLAGVAARTGGRALRDADVSGSLLALASLSLAAVLVWAAAAAAAGVAEAWASSPRHIGQDPPVTTPGPLGRGRAAVVSAGVAALVVAALTAPAVASAAPAGRAEVVASQQAPVADATGEPVGPGADGPETTRPDAAHPASDGVPDPAPALAPNPVGEAAPPGSWSALADGFRAPRGASVGTAALVTTQPSRLAPPAVAEVVVVAGDSLWSVAARHLGPGADAAEIAEAWPAWWDANRGVVGDDPDLLRPGQRLVVPGLVVPGR